ncbi:MAG: hypothetical protein ABI679_04820, partial [Gemmatimonadota bacterium]
MNQAKSASAGPSFRSPAFLRIAGVVSLSVALITCGGGDAAGPSTPAIGTVAFGAVYPSGQFSGGNLTIDGVHAVVVRPPSDTLRETTQAFDPGLDQLQLKLTALLLTATAESLDVTLDLLSGSQVLFTGTSRLEARAGSPPTPTVPTVPLVFVGPGSQLTQLTLTPIDSSLTQGDSLPMVVTGVDAGNQPVPAFYVGWSSSDTNLARINGDGVVRGRVPRGTVYIRARTPSTLALPLGVVESTTVTLLPLPASLAKVGGDNQTGPANTVLPLLLAVEVRGSDNLPIPGVTVSFAAATGGGSVDSATATTDAAGVARSGAHLGATVGAQTFTASAPKAGTATFTATASAGPIPTWTGAVSTDWNTAGNWSTGSVPTGTDDVTVPNVANQPLVGATSQVHDLSISTGAVLTIGAGLQLTVNGNLALSGTVTCPNCNLSVVGSATTQTGSTLAPSVFSIAGALSVSGTYAVSNNTLFTGTNQQIPAGLTYTNISVSGTAALTGRTSAGTHSVNIFGTGRLTLGGHTLVTGLLQVGQAPGETAALVMTNALDSVFTTNAVFNGGSEAGFLTSGVILVAGNFTQLALSSTQSFAPSGAHLVMLNGSGVQNVSFATPGVAASFFRTLIIANTAGGLTLLSNIQQSGPVAFATGVPRIVHGNGSTVSFAELLADSVTLDNVLIAANNALLTQFDSVTFQNYSPSATPLTITNPGAGSPFAFDNIKFQVVPSSGFYISVTDNAPADGVPFTVNLVNPTPGTGGAFIKTAGGAVVNWPAVATPTRMWTGVTSQNWSVASNWSPALVPTNADDVIIPTGTPVFPQLTTSCSAKTITVNSGASLSLNGINCQVQGSVFADGGISGPGSVQMQAAGQVHGNLPGLIVSAPVTMNGITSVSGSLTITGVGSKLTLNGNTISVSTNFATQGAGLLEMTNPADQLAIGGSASFDGGNELTHMSAGVLTVSGALNQSATSSGDSFHPSGTHLTILTGASPSIGFATPGDVPGTSHFQELQWSGSGTLTMQSNVFAHGTFTSVGGTITKSGATSPTLTVGNLVNSALMTLNSVLLRINQPAANPIAMSNVSFTATPGNAVALTVDHPGGAAPFTFANLTFSTVPSTGKYLVANDLNSSDLQPLTLNLTNPTPGASGGFVTVTGGAVINWPSGGAGITWTGAVSN